MTLEQHFLLFYCFAGSIAALLLGLAIWCRLSFVQKDWIIRSTRHHLAKLWTRLKGPDPYQFT